MIVGYRLSNRIGETIVVPRVLPKAVARRIIAEGFELYRVIYA